MNNYRSQSLILDYVIRITNNAHIAACGGRNFWQNEGDGASRFTALITDMAWLLVSFGEPLVTFVTALFECWSDY